MLLAACIDHPQLTVESEKQLCDAILNWCRHLGKWGDDSESVHLLQKVRISCLPVKYILGSIYGKVPFACFGVEGELALTCNDVDIWKTANDNNRFLLRLTKHSDVLDISGCQQITHSVLLLSALQRGNPMHTYSSHTPSHVRKLSSLCCGTKHNAQRRAPLLGESPVTNVKKMVISQCWRIKQEELISLLQASFPKLQELYAVNCPQIGAKLLLLLPTACPSIKVIDLSVDINDTLSQDVTVEKSMSEAIHTSMENVWPTCNCPLSYLSTLSLQGHANLVDSDFLLISSRCPNIAEISINGCTSLSDLGISSFIKCHPYLQSIHSAFTAFGGQSLEALVLNLDNAKGASDICAFQSLDISSCRGFSAGDMAKLLTLTSSLVHLALSNTVVDDNALYVLSSCCLKFLNLQDTQVSKQALTYVISKNPTLKRLNFRGCKNMKSEGHLEEPKVLDALLEKGVRQLECLEVGWGFSDCIFKTISPCVFSLRSLTLGLGTTISSSSLLELPILCPLLQSVTICFQDLSADIFTYWLRHLSNLMVFKLKHCLSDLPLRCINTFNEGFGSNLKCLKLEGSINCITDRELMILGKACERLSCFSITHCTRLSPNSLSIIAHNWRGLSELKVEECAQPTCEGASSLLDLCHALEILTLRHNGPGLPKSFISDAILKLPVLRNLSLDLCDCLEGGYETPHGSTWRSLLLVKLSRCKVVDNVFQSYTKLLKGKCHRDAIVLERSETRLRTTIVKSKY